MNDSSLFGCPEAKVHCADKDSGQGGARARNLKFLCFPFAGQDVPARDAGGIARAGAITPSWNGVAAPPAMASVSVLSLPLPGSMGLVSRR